MTEIPEHLRKRAEEAKAKMHDIIAGFDPKGEDPAMQYVRIKDALDVLFDEALDRQHGRK